MHIDDQGRLLEHLHNSPEATTIQLFGYHSVPPAWSLRFPNGLPEHLIYLVVAGSCEGTAAGQRVRLDPGSLLWLKPRAPFELWQRPSRQLTIYRFRLNPIPAVDNTLPAVTVLRDAWELRSVFDVLVAELGAALAFRDERIQAALVLLFSALFRLADRQGTSPRALDAGQRHRLEEYVDARIAMRIRPDELARLLELSPEYFTRRFTHTFGIPPKVWVVHRRIQQAAFQLDESTGSITSIARGLGYPDILLFSRQFKAVVGMSPRSYRTRQL